MNREHRLSYCRICNNQKMDTKKGIICRLTNERADFESECPNFSVNKIKEAKRAQIEQKRFIEAESRVKAKEEGGRNPIWIIIGVIIIILKLIRIFTR